MGRCVAIWWSPFTLGAWGRLLFEHILTIWAAATAALLVVIFRPGRERYRLRRAVAPFIDVAAYVLGVNHATFLARENVSISGNSEPQGCTPQPPEPKRAGRAALALELPPRSLPITAGGTRHG